jgi:hypothetical protein
MTAPNRELLIQAAIARAEHGASTANYPAIFEGFEAKGIDTEAIRPRENIFTYRVWQAKGRQVQKGEKGVKVQTFVPAASKKNPDAKGLRPRPATVFHISQTKPIDEKEDAPEQGKVYNLSGIAQGKTWADAAW